jgi:hypothetical protein
MSGRIDSQSKSTRLQHPTDDGKDHNNFKLNTTKSSHLTKPQHEKDKNFFRHFLRPNDPRLPEDAVPFLNQAMFVQGIVQALQTGDVPKLQNNVTNMQQFMLRLHNQPRYQDFQYQLNASLEGSRRSSLGFTRGNRSAMTLQQWASQAANPAPLQAILTPFLNQYSPVERY